MKLKQKMKALSKLQSHGYYSLSLIPKFVSEIWECKNIKIILNYGTEKIRFISPVKCNNNIRAIIKLKMLKNIKMESYSIANNYRNYES